jgi:NAD(P)-dependent dehydrogenase (short-subunit alcohol dehydrogenase family)
MNLKDKTAWITGGGSGIGLAGAIELARAGCRVLISGRDAAKLDAAVQLAEGRGRSAARRWTWPTARPWGAWRRTCNRAWAASTSS